VTTDKEGFRSREYKTEVLDEKKLMANYGGGGSKGATPMAAGNKRMRTRYTDNDFVESSGDEESIDYMWDVVDDQEGGRKRRRQQQSSEETAPDTESILPPDLEADLGQTLWRAMAKQQAYQEAQEYDSRVDDSPEDDSPEDDSREVKMRLSLRPQSDIGKASTYKPTGSYY